MKIRSALGKLNAAVDDHWGADGRPSIAALSQIVGENVRRKDVDLIAPDFRRPTGR